MTQKKKFISPHDQENLTMLRISIALPKIKTKMIKKSKRRKLEVMTWKLILELLEELQD